MRLALAYAHYDQHYVGGLLKRAAKRLGLEVLSIGPTVGEWLAGPPKEPDSDPDVQLPGTAPTRMRVEADVLVNVDQGNGFYVIPENPLPHAYVLTEGNTGEYAHARTAGAQAVWSCMPFKDAGRRESGVIPLNWGYDPVHTSLLEASRSRDVALHHRGSPCDIRTEHLWPAMRASALSIIAGPPVSRLRWGLELSQSQFCVADHDPWYLTGRLVDAMAAGCVVLAKRSPCLDMLAPRGYVPVAEVPWAGRHSALDLRDLFEKVERFSRSGERLDVAARAQRAVAGLSWDEQLLRILGSVGVTT